VNKTHQLAVPANKQDQQQEMKKQDIQRGHQAGLAARASNKDSSSSSSSSSKDSSSKGKSERYSSSDGGWEC
jgi:hypothetical protein